MVKVALATVVVLGAVAAWAFEPWRLWTSSTVDEPLPTVSAAPVAETVAPTVPAPTEPRDRATPSPSPSPSPSPQPPAPEVVELASGDFVDAEHGTSGVARIIELADGSRFVRLEGLATSDGPDLDVILSDAPSGGEWGSYDDGRHVTLGELKATHGNQNYEIPDDVDLAGLQSVVIWCDRFNVAFGTAPVAA